MKLYTKTDLERCARLAVLAHATDREDSETAVARALAVVVDDAPMYYDEPTVKMLLRFATGEDNVDLLFEEGLEYARSQ